MARELKFRPEIEDFTRSIEETKIELLKRRADAKYGHVPKKKSDEQKKLEKSIAEMSNDERNSYILLYNTGTVEPTLDNTIRLVEVLLYQANSIKDRADKATDIIKKDVPDIPTTEDLHDDMDLVFGDVDKSKLTPDQIICVNNILNLGALIMNEENKKPFADINTLGVDTVDPNSPINIPGVPKSKKEFMKLMDGFGNVFSWNAWTFILLLIKIMIEVIVMTLAKPICKITIKTFLGEVKIGAKLMNPVLNFIGKLIDGTPWVCSDLPDLNIEDFVKGRITSINNFIQRGGRMDPKDVFGSMDDPDADVNTAEDLTPEAYCQNPNRLPTIHEVTAAQNIKEYAIEMAKESKDPNMKDYFAMLMTASAKEECYTLSSSLTLTGEKIKFTRDETQDYGEFGGRFANAKTTRGKGTVFDDKVTKWFAGIAETMRNIDIMVSAGIELKFLGFRLRDTICCFIRLFYAMFIGNDDFKVMGKNYGKEAQEKLDEWDAGYKKVGSTAKKAVEKTKYIASLVDTLLAVFTTTVSTDWEIKLGNFNIGKLGSFVLSAIRKGVFEALATLNEVLFGSLRKLVFGYLNSLVDKDIELLKAVEECKLFNIALNWLQCLLNWIENKILDMLIKLRGEMNVAWGDIEVNIDFAFQNKQITFLRDILRLIGKFALNIVKLCNINNIKDDDAFVKLVDTIGSELGVAKYPLEDEYDLDALYGVGKVSESVMKPDDDHTGNDDNTTNFTKADKDDFGYSKNENIVVDRGTKPWQNIVKEAPTAVQKAAQLNKEKYKNMTVPDSLFIPKDEFASMCRKSYVNVGSLLRNNKALRDLFTRYDVDLFSGMPPKS